MKTNKTSVQNLLLVMAMAMPLFATTGAASANEAADEHPPMLRGGPDQGGPDSGSRMHGGMPPFGGAGMGGRAPFIGPGMGGPAPVLRGVELSEAQEDKVFAILHQEKPYLREQAKAAAKAHEALREMAGADKYDDTKAASLAQAAATAMANITLQHVRTEQKLRAVLTAEQRKQQTEDKDGKDSEGKDKPRRPRP